MLLRSNRITRLMASVKPLKFIDLAEGVAGADPGLLFVTEDLHFRVAANHRKAPESERTWVLWDMRGQAKPNGPLEKSICNPVALEMGIPTLEAAKEFATLVHHLWPVRTALTTRVMLRGLLVQAKLAVVTKLVKLQTMMA